MNKRIATVLLVMILALACQAEAALKKVYNEDINPVEQIDQALAQAKSTGKFVICQVGGNWCPWCLRFADFIENDNDISKVVNDNFVYIHVNYNPPPISRRREDTPSRRNDETIRKPCPLRIPSVRCPRHDRQNPPHTRLQLLGRGQVIQQRENTPFLQELDSGSSKITPTSKII